MIGNKWDCCVNVKINHVNRLECSLFGLVCLFDYGQAVDVGEAGNPPVTKKTDWKWLNETSSLVNRLREAAASSESTPSNDCVFVSLSLPTETRYSNRIRSERITN